MQTADFTVLPLDATFGAVVTDLILPDLSAGAFDTLYKVWLEYALLIFPGQNLSNVAQIAFAKRFGQLEFELAAISNLLPDGQVRQDNETDDVLKVLKGNMGWHCDSTYMAVQAKGAVFTAHVVPSHGGATGWADMRAAYDELDAQTKAKVQNLSAYHSLYYSQARAGFKPSIDGKYKGYGYFAQKPPLRRLVKIHPETQRPSLLIGRHAFGIPGLSKTGSEELLDGLVEFACRAPRVYHHQWQKGDAVLWDNRCLLHQGTPWDLSEARVMYHSRIAGDESTEYAASS